jgi:histone deacetylase 8
VDPSECAVVVSQELFMQTAKIGKIGPRSSMVHSLLVSYRLLGGMRLLSPARITNAELRAFHSEDFVSFLEKPNLYTEEDFGLGYDCPMLPDLGEFARVIAGGSIAAADALVLCQARVAINWHGGWHHAKAKIELNFFLRSVII